MRGVEATKDGTFRARIKHKGKNLTIGVFLSADEALAAYADAVGRKAAGMHPLPERERGPLTELDAFRAAYDYDPESGAFWHRCKRTGRRTGRRAGGVSNHGYVAIWLGSRLYLAHRVAWFVTFGRWPESQIDHINMSRTDNRLSNLREAQPRQQAMNRRTRTDSSSGLKGVCLRDGHEKRRKKYAARIKVGGKTIVVGNYETPDEAAIAYAEAARKYFGEFARAD